MHVQSFESCIAGLLFWSYYLDKPNKIRAWGWRMWRGDLMLFLFCYLRYKLVACLRLHLAIKTFSNIRNFFYSNYSFLLLFGTIHKFFKYFFIKFSLVFITYLNLFTVQTQPTWQFLFNLLTGNTKCKMKHVLILSIGINLLVLFRFQLFDSLFFLSRK